MPVVAAIMTLRMCGICDALYNVISPPAGDGIARHPRGSIGIGINRCWTNLALTMCVAVAKAAAVASGSGSRGQW
jgi:hypothetical protein